MSLKMMTSNLLVSAFVVLGSAAAVGCGDSGGGGGDTDAGGGGGDSGGGSGTYDSDAVLINATGQSATDFVAQSHMVELVQGDGTPYDPPITATTGSGTGLFTLKNIPQGADRSAWIHVIGQGPADNGDSTFDAITLADRNGYGSKPGLVRITTVGTAGYAAGTGAFTPADDRIAIGGAIYLVNDKGNFIGSVGCAEVWVDDNPSPYEEYAQRYLASNHLPTTIEKQNQTLTSGEFYFGNLSKGPHTFKVTMDHGATFIGEPFTVNIPFSRSDATSDYKDFLALFSITYAGDDPTPSDCPSE